jgi:hypothetical protein
MSAFPRSRLTSRTHRLINSRFPAVGVFDDIAGSEADLRDAFEIESLTSGRLLGAERLARIPGGAVVAGPGATLVMAAFLYSDENGGRFTDRRLGAWYASTEVETAIAETVYHNERRLRASGGGFPARIQLRELVAELDDDYLDLRGRQGTHPELYHPSDYSASQAFAANLRWPFGDEIGLIYDSVRRVGGTNVCIFQPAAVGVPVVQSDHYEYAWDANRALDVQRLTSVSLA